MSTMRSVWRQMERAEGTFKRRGKIRGWRRHLLMQKQLKKHRPMKKQTNIFAALFNQILAAGLRAVKNKKSA